MRKTKRKKTETRKKKCPEANHGIGYNGPLLIIAKPTATETRSGSLVTYVLVIQLLLSIFLHLRFLSISADSEFLTFTSSLHTDLTPQTYLVQFILPLSLAFIKIFQRTYNRIGDYNNRNFNCFQYLRIMLGFIYYCTKVSSYF